MFDAGQTSGSEPLEETLFGATPRTGTGYG